MVEQPVNTQAAPSRSWLWLFCAAVLLAGLAFTGFQTLFSSFAPYDDEGYVMISLKSFMDGHALYDETYTQYGPAFFQLSGLLHRTLDLPITHDVMRFKTLFAWILTAGLAGLVIYRITSNRWLALTAVALSFFHIDRLGLEPAHPQELCVLLLMMCLAIVTWFDGLLPVKTSRAPWVKLMAIGGIGLIISVIILTKVNLGIFLVLSFSLTLLAVGSSSRIEKGLFALFVSLSILMPIVLMRKHLASFEGALLPVLVIGSMLVLAYFWSRLEFRKSTNGLQDIVVFAAAALLGCAAITVLTMIQGTTAEHLLEGLVLQHTEIGAYRYAPLFGILVPAILLSAWCADRVIRQHDTHIQKWIDLGVTAVLGCVILRQFSDSFMPLLHGGTDRSLATFLTSIVTPFAWVILIPLLRSDDSVKTESPTGIARLGLCFVAVIQPMQVFPIPGTQMGLGSICLVLILLIAFSDLLSRGTVFVPVIEAKPHRAVAVLAAILFLLVGVRDVSSFQRRSECVSLNLPGAIWMRLPQEEADQIRWVVEGLKQNSDTFFGVPNGYQSFYFWTEMNPPTHLNATFWPTLLNDAQQTTIKNQIESEDRACVLIHQNAGNWQSFNTLLTRYVSEQFEPLETRGHYEIWVRKSASPQRQLAGSN